MSHAHKKTPWVLKEKRNRGHYKTSREEITPEPILKPFPSRVSPAHRRRDRATRPRQGDFGRPSLAEFGGDAPSFADYTDGAGRRWGWSVFHGGY